MKRLSRGYFVLSLFRTLRVSLGGAGRWEGEGVWGVWGLGIDRLDPATFYRTNYYQQQVSVSPTALAQPSACCWVSSSVTLSRRTNDVMESGQIVLTD